MKILALEFSSDARSVAIVDAPATPVAGIGQSRVLGRAEQQAGRGTKVFALVTAALQEAGVPQDEVECLAIGLGPGSYTGIRIAIAVAQGWQLGRSLRVVGINSVEVLAWQAHESGLRGPVGFLLDAQRGELYHARYELTDLAPRLLDPLQLKSPAETPISSDETWIVEPGLLKSFPTARVMCPDAAALGRLAATRYDFVTADVLEPVYLREPSFLKAPPPRVIPPLTP